MVNKRRDLDTGLANRVTEARKKAGLNQTELARKLGISRITLNRMEGATRPISSDLLRIISEITEVDPSWLLTGKESDRTRSEKISEIQKILSGMTVAERKEPYGLTNRDRFWMAFGREIDTKEGAEHLIRAIYEAGRAGHVPVDELLKRYRE